MKEIKFEKSYLIKGECSRIRKYLVDLKIYGSIHPLIKKVTRLNDPYESVVHYEILEQPYHWLPIKIKYNALVSQNGNSIHYVIKNIPQTDAEIEYELKKKKNNICEAIFCLKIKGPPPGKKILLNKMIKAQDQFMVNLQTKL